jgi:hypothetical protein
MTEWYGGWEYKKSNNTLTYKACRYEIDLDEITSSAVMLDFIFQINSKKWGKGHCIADLIEALDDVLDPQANYCSMGRECYKSKKGQPT